MKTIEIISLIYRSKQYLNFIASEMLSDDCLVPGHNVSLRIVANDPTAAIESALLGCPIPSDIYRDPSPFDYYLNRVYRCWNYAARSSKADYVCLINSDMAFSPNWLTNLVKNVSDKTIVTSRLVESGRMVSGTHGISQNFGMHPNEFKKEDWSKYADSVSVNYTRPDGLYMPLLISTDLFSRSGGFPEGNVYPGGIGMYKTGHVKMSGDTYFFKNNLEARFGVKHITAFDSVVYHFQSGEMLLPEDQL